MFLVYLHKVLVKLLCVLVNVLTDVQYSQRLYGPFFNRWIYLLTGHLISVFDAIEQNLIDLEVFDSRMN